MMRVVTNRARTLLTCEPVFLTAVSNNLCFFLFASLSPCLEKKHSSRGKLEVSVNQDVESIFVSLGPPSPSLCQLARAFP